MSVMIDMNVKDKGKNEGSLSADSAIGIKMIWTSLSFHYGYIAAIITHNFPSSLADFVACGHGFCTTHAVALVSLLLSV